MRRFVLWIAAILITFAIGIGADRLWWHFLAAAPPPPPAKVEPLAINCGPPIRDIMYVPAPAPSPTPNFILDYDPEESSMWAVFYVMSPKPKEFADIDSFEVSLSPAVDNHPGMIFVTARRGGDYENAEATFALVTERRLFFTTDKLSNSEFEYRFDGELLRKDFDAVAGKNKAVLRGTLTKMKNGRTIAQAEFTFRMEHMGC